MLLILKMLRMLKRYNVFLGFVTPDKSLHERVITLDQKMHLLQVRKGQHHSDDFYCTIEISSQNRPRVNTSKNVDVPISVRFLFFQGK
jgi:hypothetical protein